MINYKLLTITLMFTLFAKYNIAQSAVDLYKSAVAEIQTENYSETNLANAIKYFNKSIKKDSNFAEAYYLLGKIYSMSNYNSSKSFPKFDSKEKAEMYFIKAIDIVNEDYILKDTNFTKREIYLDIANQYLMSDDLNSNEESLRIRKSIEFYKKAIQFPYVKKIKYLFSINEYEVSDKDIQEKITYCYSQLGDIAKSEKDYKSFFDYYNESLKICKLIDFDESLVTGIKRNTDIARAYIDAGDWEVFTGDRNDEWITEGGGSIYFYYPASLEHINQNIFRIWIKRLQLGKDTLTAKNTYESKMLYEIDSKNSKVRTLSLSYYNKEGQLLSKIETEDPKWSFIVPESISYDIWKYFKYK